ncbi:hypothetical protein BT96DRAFT_947897 [Gymnopus androsaceus JB14]|uniref:Uncharacterized protein n=1 Tax=Gymnopus androsaceus JB14 TaxID=1447944 RepID=A0A6A4GS97_9AGAR|nr:hypothetical protein BT96DRAFT_947897 [Gymnopus androsaceus JB14]
MATLLNRFRPLDPSNISCNVEVESKTSSWVSFPHDKRLFGELNVGLFKKTMMHVEQVLKDASIMKDDIDEVNSFSTSAFLGYHDEAIVYGATRVVFSLEGTADVFLVHPLVMIELIPCKIAIPFYREISNIILDTRILGICARPGLPDGWPGPVISTPAVQPRLSQLGIDYFNLYLRPVD